MPRERRNSRGFLLFSAGQLDRDRYWKARAQSEKEKAQKLAAENGVRGGRLLDAVDVETMQRELAHQLRRVDSNRLTRTPMTPRG